MSDVLAGIDVFVASVETGSFSAAAERMGLTRSAVAKTVARLESRLAVRLFHRSTRRQSLTADGQVYYERCVRALDELRAGRSTLESGRREAVGRLRVAMPLLFGRRCVAPVLARLAARHPRLEIDMALSDRLVDVVDDGYDLAIRNGAIGDGSGLMTRTVGLQRMTVCAAPAYLAVHGAPAGLADLSRHHAITYARDGRVKAWTFPLPGGPVEATPPSRLRFDDLESIAEAAEAGHGLAWLPCWLIRDRVHAGTLVPLLADLPRLVFSTHALWPASPHLPVKVRLALDALAAELPGSAEL
ncbi:HTH-type transcriptional regulator DmlR [Starkeya nomas]|uniref:HTH-type transcriptional regulator DmlR n=2 Tax=Xanthobacteraceae TaxID=335928 RepID=A0A5S9Q144_9HYPH|nr:MULTISPECIES: LysR family transcriptional regulator [Xanthobacteraceae]TSJ64270.1 LysR family transcriptional regulator [Ancylobacter moscoviensis]CAA0110855.1 HTH-type transcriptional regulator DmlR [Starkeya nomas]